MDRINSCGRENSLDSIHTIANIPLHSTTSSAATSTTTGSAGSASANHLDLIRTSRNITSLEFKHDLTVSAGEATRILAARHHLAHQHPQNHHNALYGHCISLSVPNITLGPHYQDVQNHNFHHNPHQHQLHPQHHQLSQQNHHQQQQAASLETDMINKFRNMTISDPMMNMNHTQNEHHHNGNMESHMHSDPALGPHHPDPSMGPHHPQFHQPHQQPSPHNLQIIPYQYQPQHHHPHPTPQPHHNVWVPPNPYLFEPIPHWLYVYSRAPSSLDHMLKVSNILIHSLIIIVD